MHYNGIIFDFNGTLFFDTDIHIQAWDTIAMKVIGKHMTKETLVQKYWYTFQRSMQAFICRKRITVPYVCKK